eukprot:TRINITY_DN2973_c0_g1_i1.p1 TRINITY_DN2973_c0_g1~~TRINITY_DN2973_c0_g1_i1.p1  ORF type:complete len:692 (-),score=87.87 TRINITY_DN2973_c0_g1_i1:84-2123(-)
MEERSVRRVDRVLHHLQPLDSLVSSSPTSNSQVFSYTEEVSKALKEGAPVVALESTVISHGLPYPDNVALAREMESIVRRGGATPATIAIIQGQICVGLTDAQLERLGRPNGGVVKVSVRDIAATVAQHLDGATTVAATSFIAAKCGIRVFATGGIGGVHREGQVTMDISADLPTLADSHICVVCAGAKSILDLPRTLEYLETLGVCVAGYKTREFPAFFTRHSGLPLECTVQDATQAAQLLHTSMTLGIRQGVLLCVPIAPEHEADGKRIEEATRQALDEANRKGVVGKLITPFLLSRVNELTQGLSKKANLALLKQNASVATAVAVQLSKLQGHQLPGETKSTPGCLVVGGSAIDLISKPFQDGTLRDNHGLSLPGSISLKFGGVGRNVAELVHRGAPRIGCALVTSVGSETGQLDSFAELLLQDCKSLGLSLDAIPVNGAKTSFYNANLYANGDLRAAICDFSCMESIQGSTLSYRLNSAAPGIRLVIADANLSSAALSSVATFASEKGIPLFGLATSAPKVVRWAPYLSHLRYLILNLAELDALLDHLQPSLTRDARPEQDQGLRAQRQLLALAQFTPKTDIVCTVGARGAYVYLKGNASVVHVAAAPCDAVIDVTGAGDSMAAGIAIGILHGSNIVEASRMGSAIAAATLSSGSIRSCPVQEVVRSHTKSTISS